MSLLDLFKRNKKSSASIAKERLQIIVAHESNRRQGVRGGAGAVDLQELKRKLIDLIADHLKIPANEVRVELEHDQDRSILELNVTLPDRV
jgi:cell division topological specificity factor